MKTVPRELIVKDPETTEEKIRSLLARRFPSTAISSAASGFDIQVSPQIVAAISEYEADLRNRTAQEIDTLYEKQRAKEREREAEATRAEWASMRAEQREKERIFYQPPADANFEYWGKMAYWKLDEAVALSFGKAPELVNWKNVQPAEFISRFAGEYAKRRQLVERAKVCKQLSEPTYPHLFLTWAKQNEITYPPELEAEVKKRGKRVVDWPAFIADYKQRTQRDIEQMREIKSRIDILMQTDQEKPLKGKVRTSLLTMILGMAKAKYDFDPHAARSPVPSRIASDLQVHGLALDEDTVRKWLREAAEELADRLAAWDK